MKRILDIFSGYFETKDRRERKRLNNSWDNNVLPVPDRSFPLRILEARRVHFSLELDIRVRLVSGSYRVERVAGRVDRGHVDIVPRPILLSLAVAILQLRDLPIDPDLVGQMIIRFVVGPLTKAFLELQQISEKRLAFAAEQTCSETIPRVYRSLSNVSALKSDIPAVLAPPFPRQRALRVRVSPLQHRLLLPVPLQLHHYHAPNYGVQVVLLFAVAGRRPAFFPIFTSPRPFELALNEEQSLFRNLIDQFSEEMENVVRNRPRISLE